MNSLQLKNNYEGYEDMTNRAVYKGKVRDKNGYAVHLFYE